MAKDNSKRDSAARSYDQSVSNRAQKHKKPSRPQGDKPSSPTGASEPAPSKDTAKTHKDAASDRRVVFKSTLDTPFRVEWPVISPALVTSFLDAFLQIVNDAEVSKYQAARGRRVDRGDAANVEGDPDSTNSRKKKRKRAKNDPDVDASPEGNGPAARHPKRHRVEGEDAAAGLPPPLPPAILSHIVVGINHVTKRLEGRLEHLSAKKKAVVGAALAAEEPSPPPPLKYVLVCTGDIDPPALVAHVPHLVAGCNSNSTTEVTCLVPLHKGAEAQLAKAFGLPRASVVGIAASAPAEVLSRLETLSVSFPLVRAPWLVIPSPPSRNSEAEHDAMDLDPSPTKSTSTLIPTHIKQLRTSAPRNMGAAKRARKEARAAVRAKLVTRPQSTIGGGKPLKKARVIVTPVTVTPVTDSTA